MSGAAAFTLTGAGHQRREPTAPAGDLVDRRQPAPSGVPTPSPPAAPESVIIEVEGAPPGTSAVVDGERQVLPIRLDKGTSAREVRFEAPGYQPKTRHLDGSRSRTLVIEDWKRIEEPPPAGHPTRRPRPEGESSRRGRGHDKPAATTEPSAISPRPAPTPTAPSNKPKPFIDIN